jgi:molybdopterin-guanine dinucleotide biosynthesis protein A
VFPSVRARLRAGELAVHAFLQGGAVEWIEGADLAALDPDGLSFFNVNTPEDLRRADEIAGRGA